jgi:hypothetical protein
VVQTFGTASAEVEWNVTVAQGTMGRHRITIRATSGHVEVLDRLYPLSMVGRPENGKKKIRTREQRIPSASATATDCIDADTNAVTIP